jgi:transposase-like protein
MGLAGSDARGIKKIYVSKFNAANSNNFALYLEEYEFRYYSRNKNLPEIPIDLFTRNKNASQEPIPF